MDAMKQEFEENGYIVLKKALDGEEISSLKDKLDIVYSQTITHAGADLKGFKNLDEKYIFLRDSHPELKARAYDLTKHLEIMWRYAVKRRIIEIVGDIVGNEVLVDFPQVRIDDPENHRLLPMHQEGYGQISDNAITAWIPLQDVGSEVGTLAVEVQSHRRGYLPSKNYPEMNNAHGVREEFIDRDKVLLLEMNKGDAVIFHPCLIHGSVANPSNAIRWTFVSRYNDISNIPYLQDLDAPYRTEQKDE